MADDETAIPVETSTPVVPSDLALTARTSEADFEKHARAVPTSPWTYISGKNSEREWRRPYHVIALCACCALVAPAGLCRRSVSHLS